MSNSVSRGIAEDDLRNRGVIEYFRPKDVTADTAREALRRVSPHASADEIERRVQGLISRIAAKPVKPPPPLSQALTNIPDPHYGLGSTPDLVVRLWRLDETLPQCCRWVFWGKPALVHPATGVVLAVAFGTIGIVVRLPKDVLDRAAAGEAPPAIAGNPGQSFDISPAGPEWRFLRRGAPAAEWCLAAYGFASVP
ncbi:MAG: hypothetical protein WAV27_14735 [Xanthobacteraceae bacterium]